MTSPASISRIDTDTDGFKIPEVPSKKRKRDPKEEKVDLLCREKLEIQEENPPPLNKSETIRKIATDVEAKKPKILPNDKITILNELFNIKPPQTR